jgi:hypothetical protein
MAPRWDRLRATCEAIKGLRGLRSGEVGAEPAALPGGKKLLDVRLGKRQPAAVLGIQH